MAGPDGRLDPRLDKARWTVGQSLSRSRDGYGGGRARAWLEVLRDDQPEVAADLEQLLEERRTVLEERFLEARQSCRRERDVSRRPHSSAPIG